MSEGEDERAVGDDQHGMVAGYRVIRTLGVGSRATVLLGHAEAGSVALKVFAAADGEIDDDNGDEDIAAELRAFEAVDSEHVVRLVDVCSAPGAPTCLVLERLDGGSLAALMRQRGRVRAGEAVTILVSVLRGIRAVHAAGLSHNALRPASVLFDRRGRPALISLGHTSRLPPAYAENAVAARSIDWTQLRGISDMVLERTQLDGHEAVETDVRRALDELCGSADENLCVQRLEDALFAFAQPAPIMLRAGSAAEPTRRSRPDAVQSRPVIPRAEAILDAGPIRALKAAMAPPLRRRRKPLLFGALLAGTVCVVGLAAIPSTGERPGDTIARSHSPSTTARSPTAAAAGPVQDGVTADDPVAAATALLTARAECMEERSARCLAGVDQADSPLLAADTAAMAHPDDVTDYAGADVSLIERTGNSALVELVRKESGDDVKPASALVIKGEAGWRLREIFAD